MNKRGDYKYGIILSLILGLMVLSLSLFFIFNEYFSEEDAEWEICRQSIQVRSEIPAADLGVLGEYDVFKDKFPLKCKTNVVEIDVGDVKDIEKAEKIVAEAMVNCWMLFDNGKARAFPAKFVTYHSYCVPCARIYLTEGAKGYMKDNKVEIDINHALKGQMSKEYSYYMYLRDSGDGFQAFNPGAHSEFDREGDIFDVDPLEPVSFDVPLWPDAKISKVYLPRNISYDGGDLLINYGVIVVRNGAYDPYLFYFQVNQKKPNPFEEISTKFYRWGAVSILDDLTDASVDVRSVGVCDSWEGIPA